MSNRLKRPSSHVLFRFQVLKTHFHPVLREKFRFSNFKKLPALVKLRNQFGINVLKEFCVFVLRSEIENHLFAIRFFQEMFQPDFPGNAVVEIIGYQLSVDKILTSVSLVINAANYIVHSRWQASR